MPDEPGRLDIYCRERPIGKLWLDQRRRFVFQYDPEWLAKPVPFPLSLSLPLRPEPYHNDASRPFFANLIPEGELLKLIARRLHLSQQNTYSLLEKIGGDCAGAISVFPHPGMPLERSGYRELDNEALHQVLVELPKRPLLAGEEGTRISLAGAQNKLPVYMEGDRIFIATGSSPSTHILKPPMSDFDGTVEAEKDMVQSSQ